MAKEIADNSFENFKGIYDALSVGELSERIEKTKKALSVMERLMEDKTVKKFPYDGKYIVIYNGFATNPIYMHCSFCKFDNTGFHDEPMIWFHGVSFRYEFGPYEDSNYVEFSSANDVYMPYRRFVEQENKRKKYEDSEEIPFGYDSYKVEVIPALEYIEAYNEMIDNMRRNPDYFYHDKITNLEAEGE